MLLLVRYETTNSIMHTQNSLYRKVNDSRVLFSEKQVFGETLDVENEIRWKTSEFEPFHCRITFSFIFLSQRKMISGFNSFLCSNTTKQDVHIQVHHCLHIKHLIGVYSRQPFTEINSEDATNTRRNVNIRFLDRLKLLFLKQMEVVKNFTTGLDKADTLFM